MKTDKTYGAFILILNKEWFLELSVSMQQVVVEGGSVDNLFSRAVTGHVA